MTLSDKKWTSPLSERDLYTKEDIKEFIKELKEEVMFYFLKDDMPNREKNVQDIIDKLAGDDLIDRGQEE